MRIGLLLCDHVSPDLLGVAGDYTDMMTALFGHHPEIEVVPYDVVKGGMPAGPNECDAWMTTGSRYSVHDDEAWIRSLETFIRDVAAKEVPFVGICFGHQLLAKALGGEVVISESGWEVGIKEIQLSTGISFFPDDLGSYSVINSHTEQIRTPPKGATVIGWSEHCPVSMMVVGSSMLGIQGHPEMSKEYAEALINSRSGSSIPYEVAAQGVASLVVHADSQVVADLIVRFLAGANSGL